MFILLYKEAYFNANKLDPFIPSVVVFLLHEFDDVFPEDVPNSLPSLKEMQHQVDIIHGVVIHNWPTYRSNPEKTETSKVN